MDDDLPSKFNVPPKKELRAKNQENRMQEQSNKPENKDTYEANRLKKRKDGDHLTDNDDEEGV